jgi:hypothetical protein
MSDLKPIGDYLRAFAAESGERIIKTYPALHKPEDPVSPEMNTLLRRPYRAQELAAMGVIRRWQEARAAAVIGECGTGKTLIALAAIHCHSEGRLYTALVSFPVTSPRRWRAKSFRRSRESEFFSSTPCETECATECPPASNSQCQRADAGHLGTSGSQSGEC